MLSELFEVALVVNDLHRAMNKELAGAACEAAGVVVIRSAYQFSPAIRNAIVEDPDGNIVEFCHGLAWDSDTDSR